MSTLSISPPQIVRARSATEEKILIARRLSGTTSPQQDVFSKINKLLDAEEATELAQAIQDATKLMSDSSDLFSGASVEIQTVRTDIYRLLADASERLKAMSVSSQTSPVHNIEKEKNFGKSPPKLSGLSLAFAKKV